MQKTVRLDSFLAHAGVLSRRSVKLLLKKDVVTVDGKPVREAGFRLDPEHAVVKVNGKKVSAETYVYYLLNKPKGYISAVSDRFTDKTVTSLVPQAKRIYPVGRLDKDTHGLIILTNDGPLTHALTHPRYHIPKTYRLFVSEAPTPEQLLALRKGVLLKDGITRPATVRIEKSYAQKTALLMTIHEGRNRQIRRMCETIGITLLDLSRISFGQVLLGSLKLGAYRPLSPKEITMLKTSAGM